MTDRPGHDARYAIDASKISSELGWRPRHDFDSGLRDTVRWFLDNRGWWEQPVGGLTSAAWKFHDTPFNDPASGSQSGPLYVPQSLFTERGGPDLSQEIATLEAKVKAKDRNTELKVHASGIAARD